MTHSLHLEAACSKKLTLSFRSSGIVESTAAGKAALNIETVGQLRLKDEDAELHDIDMLTSPSARNSHCAPTPFKF